MSRSTLDDPEAEQRVSEHTDDAFRLLEALSPGEPARVFGSSSGAITGLHLLATRPERVELLVAHEPPLVEVLPDALEHRALIGRVRATFETEGLMPAMAVFAEGVKQADESAGPRPEPQLPPQAVERIRRTTGNLPLFVGRIVPSFMSYAPDLHRLRELSDRLVLAAGQDSRGELLHRPAALLAERLGTELRQFPGGHTGLTTHPAQFGEFLQETLQEPLRAGAGQRIPRAGGGSGPSSS